MRTYGTTINCAGCRFWSEMIARAHGSGGVEALCMADGGPRSGQYTTPRATCGSWRSGHNGAVDEPPNYGEETRKLYAAEDAKNPAPVQPKPPEQPKGRERHCAYCGESIGWIEDRNYERSVTCGRPACDRGMRDYDQPEHDDHDDANSWL